MARLRDVVPMAKYDPLHAYLKRQKGDACELSFREIENMIGYLLPKGASESAWWGNVVDETTSRTVQRHAWLGAGFHAQLLKSGERVAFARIAAPALSALAQAG